MRSNLGKKLQRLSYALYWVLSATVFAADQITKHLVEASIPLYAVFPVVPGLLNLTHTKNSGAAFGMFADWSGPFKTVLLVGVSFALLGLILTMLIRQRPLRWVLGTGLALLLGGALGNLIDRIRFGHVVDFLDLYLRDYHWYTFNVADSAISVGAAFLILDALHSK